MFIFWLKCFAAIGSVVLLVLIAIWFSPYDPDDD